MCRAPGGQGEAVVAVVEASDEAAEHDAEALGQALDERMAQLGVLCKGLV